MGCTASKPNQVIEPVGRRPTPFKHRRKMSTALQVVRNEKISQPTDNMRREKTAEEHLPESVISLDWGIIGGFDPYTGIYKECQDDCFTYVVKEDGDRGHGVAGDIVMGLFDGHGEYGKRMSWLCVRNAVDFLLGDPEYGKEGDMYAAISNTFARLDDVLGQEKRTAELSGTTGMLVVIRGDTAYVGNVGDSRTIVVETLGDDVIGKPLTLEHDFAIEEERERVKATGGIVKPITDKFNNRYGPDRAWIPGYELPGIAMSRSLGDLTAHRIGISSVPDIEEYKIEPGKTKMICMASDGVWEVMESNDVAARILVGTDSDNLGMAVCKMALKKWEILLEHEDAVIDDISAVVVAFA